MDNRLLYCVCTIELNQCKDAKHTTALLRFFPELTDVLEISCGAIFIAGNVCEDSILRFAKTMSNELIEDHDAVIIHLDGSHILDAAEIIICNNTLYLKQALAC